jgi:hypothetical protein
MKQINSSAPTKDVIDCLHKAPGNLQSNGVAVENILGGICLNLTQPECTDRWN